MKNIDVGLRRLGMLNMDMGSRNYPCMNIMQYNHEGGKIEVYRCNKRTRRHPKDICLSCEVFCFLWSVECSTSNIMLL